MLSGFPPFVTRNTAPHWHCVASARSRNMYTRTRISGMTFLWSLTTLLILTPAQGVTASQPSSTSSAKQTTVPTQATNRSEHDDITTQLPNVTESGGVSTSVSDDYGTNGTETNDTAILLPNATRAADDILSWSDFTTPMTGSQASKARDTNADMTSADVDVNAVTTMTTPKVVTDSKSASNKDNGHLTSQQTTVLANFNESQSGHKETSELSNNEENTTSTDITSRLNLTKDIESTSSRNVSSTASLPQSSTTQESPTTSTSPITSSNGPVQESAPSSNTSSLSIVHLSLLGLFTGAILAVLALMLTLVIVNRYRSRAARKISLNDETRRLDLRVLRMDINDVRASLAGIPAVGDIWTEMNKNSASVV